jgi:hypothetical protein
MGMDKSGTQVVGQNVFTKIVGWTARADRPATSIVNDGLVMNGTGNVSIDAHVERSGSTLNFTAHVCKNGVEVLTPVTIGSGVTVASITGTLAVATGDVITVEAQGASSVTGNRTVTTATYLTVTPV